MITLGIDPGLRRVNPAGWALFDDVASEIVDCGVIQPPTKLDAWEDRIDHAAEQIELLVRSASHQRRGVFVSALAVESAFVKPRPGGKIDPTVYAKQAIFGWECRRIARDCSLLFSLVNPLDQSRVKAQIPDQILDAAVAHLPTKLREHAKSAIAIAWHASGVLARQLLVAGGN